jgi:hypothetical protein
MESKTRNGYRFLLNAVKGYYLGLQGNFQNNVYWKFMASYSLHTIRKYPGFPIRDFNEFIPQTSLGVQISKNVFKNLNFQAEIGYDQGERITNTMGIKLGLKYFIQ